MAKFSELERKLITCLQDIQEWLETGAVNGVFCDDTSVMGSIRDALRGVSIPYALGEREED